MENKKLKNTETVDLDNDSESDLDEEQELRDLDKLTAVLQADEQASVYTSQPSTSSTIITDVSSFQYKMSKIDHALALNKMMDEKLRKLEGIFIGRLHECRERLKLIEGTARSAMNKMNKPFKYINCGKPYFRTLDNKPLPDNEDVVIMKKANMYDFSNITSVPGWTMKDKSLFLTLIHKMSIEYKKNEIRDKITELERNYKLNPNKNISKLIVDLKIELVDVKNKSLSEVALPLSEEYDWHLIAQKTSYRHTPDEYRSLWKLFLHPSITKTAWSKVEHTNLQSIAHRNAFKNWDKIAEELGTGRTGYQCFVYFRTNVNSTLTGQKWSQEEEEYLKRLIEYYKEDKYIPWNKITSLMENRTKIQIYNKYNRLIERRKGRFLPEEDAVILTCVKEFGEDFNKMTKYLPGRSLGQIRTRYNVLAHTQGTRTSTVWTEDEDRKLLQLMANQDSGTNYSTLQAYFPGKKRFHIRTRYQTLMKWMKKHPNCDISKAPRRGARRLCHGQATQDLGKAIENLKSRMKTEVERKKSNRITINSPEHVIDDAIVAAIVNEYIKRSSFNDDGIQEQTTSASSSNTVSSLSLNVKNMQKVLILLKAKLNKKIFESSIYSQKYPGLTSSNALVLKSYSKTKKVQVLDANNPDIWGNNMLNASEYVFPPNYSTITGCRALMAYASANKRKTDHMNFGALAKRNVILQKQLEILMDRFKDLFLWPMLLSNENRVDMTLPKSIKAKNRKRGRLSLNLDESREDAKRKKVNEDSEESSSDSDTDSTGEG